MFTTDSAKLKNPFLVSIIYKYFFGIRVLLSSNFKKIKKINLFLVSKVSA